MRLAPLHVLLLRALLVGVLVGTVLGIAGLRDAAAQSVVLRGRVTDASTGAALVAATVQVDGTRQGTITNDDGAFALSVGRLPRTLVVRAIGYTSERRRVTTTDASIDIALVPAPIELALVDVEAEDPALRIMRQVLAAKRRQRAALASTTAQAYTRFTIRSDTGIVAITETASDVFWRRDGGTREILRQRRKTANFPGEAFLPAAGAVLDLTDDDIEIAGFRFVGVTHPDALSVYRFALTGTRVLDGTRVFDLSVRPRDPLAVAFEGRIAVLDSAFALVDAELAPGPAFRFPPPIARYDTRYRQGFSDFGQGVWLPTDFRAETAVEVAMPGLRFPAFRIEQVSRLSDYAVNAPTPDSLYARRRPPLTVDTLAVRAAPDTLRGVPLSVEESAAYAGIDSTESLAEAFRPTGPLARFVRLRIGGGEAEASAGGRRSALGLAPRLWANRVEGVHAGARVAPRIGRLGVRGEIGYATAPRLWDRSVRAEVALGPVRRRLGRPVTLHASTGVETAPMAASYVRTRPLATIGFVSGFGDSFDYTRRTRTETGVDVRLARRATVGLAVSDERHRALDAVASIPTSPSSSGPAPENPSPGVDRLRTLAATATLGAPPQLLGVLSGTGARLTVEHAAPWLGSDAGFTRAAAVVDLHVPTFGRRRPFPAAFDVRLVAQAMTGDRVRPRWGLVEASWPGLTPFGALRTLQPRPTAAPALAAVFWEHNARTLVWERLGLDALTRRGYNLLVHGAHAASSQTASVVLPGASGTHHELGASLSGLFGVLRLDATARLDRPAVTVGLSTARLF